MKTEKSCVVLMSGGMDSCVTAALMAARGYCLNVLHTTYGQRTERKERECFERIADRLDAEQVLLAEREKKKKLQRAGK